MSISNFQEKFIKGGCGVAILVVSGCALVFSMVFSNCSRAQRIGATDIKGNKEKTAVVVGDVDIPVSMIDEMIDSQTKQVPPEILSAYPQYKIQAIGMSVVQSVQAAQMYEVAKRDGYKPDDEAIKKTLHISSEKEFRQILVENLRKNGQLKPDSTDKDLEDLASKAGKKLSELYTEQLAQVDKYLKDNQKRMQLVLGASQSYVNEKAKAGINPTDEDLKKQFDTLQVKRIIFKTDAKVTADQAKEKADKAIADLKGGKSFEDEIDAVSEDVPAPGKKKKSENIIPLPAAQLDNVPDYKPVLALQPGAYTEPVKVTEGYAIFKLIEKKQEVPKDFDTNKNQYKQQYIDQQASKKVKEMVEKVEKEVKPNFQVKGYEAAYLFAKSQGQRPGPEQDKLLKDAYDVAAKVTEPDDKPEIAVLVRVLAIQTMYEAPTADKTKLKADKIASFEEYLKMFDNWPYRKEVIDNFKELKQGDKAYEQLNIALDKNMKYDTSGQAVFSDISAKFLELKAAGLLKPDQEKEFTAKQTQWNSDKKKYDDQQAELKKQQAEADKKAAEEAKKSKAATGSPAPSSNQKPAGK